MAGKIPCGCFGAIFAELGGIGFLRLAPGATDAHEAAGLVLPEQLFAQFDGTRFFPQNDGAKAFERPPAADRTVIVVNFLARGDSSILIV